MSRLISWRRAAGVLGALTIAAGSAAAQRTQGARGVPAIPYTRYVLPNGLIVILNEDHSAPVVGTQVAYHVGVKDELPGKVGLTHLFEHLMFDGSQNVAPAEYRSVVQGAGGRFNASTGEDKTDYWALVPTQYLETVLWMESDRMATLPLRLTQDRLDAEREIVKNERLQKVENVPYGRFRDVTTTALFPPDNPYYATSLNPTADQANITLDDLKAFFAKYYGPNNAVLAISGDFKTAEVKRLIEKYFGPIPRAPVVTHRVVKPVVLSGEQRLVLEDSRARTTRMQITWAGVGFAHPDKVRLNAVASILSGGRTSGLTKALVYDRQLATRVSVAHYDLEHTGLLQIDIFPRPEASLTQVEQVVDSVIADMRKRVSTESVARFYGAFVDTALTLLQTRATRADTLALGELFAKDPGMYAKFLAQAAALTPADVQRAMQQYLKPERIVTSFVPAGKLDQISKPNLPYKNVTRPTALNP